MRCVWELREVKVGRLIIRASLINLDKREKRSSACVGRRQTRSEERCAYIYIYIYIYLSAEAQRSVVLPLLRATLK